jgi:hypothetical protein
MHSHEIMAHEKPGSPRCGSESAGGSDSDNSIWFIASAKEQLALTANWISHGISFGYVLKLVCNDPVKKWQAALVLLKADWVLETLLRRLARGLYLIIDPLLEAIVRWWLSARIESKRAGSVFALPARAISIRACLNSDRLKRTNTSWRSIRPQPAVSRRLFRCLGAHLLRSP